VTVTGAAGERSVPVDVARAASSQHELVELIGPLFGEGLGAVAKLRVVVAAEAVAGASEADAEASTDVLSSALSRAQLAQLTPFESLAQIVPIGQRPALMPASPLGADRSQLWQLVAPDTLRAERRDAHRRTRRAKQRRRDAERVQSQLFAYLDG